MSCNIRLIHQKHATTFRFPLYDTKAVRLSVVHDVWSCLGVRIPTLFPAPRRAGL